MHKETKIMVSSKLISHKCKRLCTERLPAMLVRTPFSPNIIYNAMGTRICSTRRGEREKTRPSIAGQRQKLILCKYYAVRFPKQKAEIAWYTKIGG